MTTKLPDYSRVFVTREGEWRLPEEYEEKWVQMLPKIDVGVELTKAAEWLIQNPRRRKTKRGMPRFLFAWLSRADHGKSKLHLDEDEYRAFVEAEDGQ